MVVYNSFVCTIYSFKESMNLGLPFERLCVTSVKILIGRRCVRKELQRLIRESKEAKVKAGPSFFSGAENEAGKKLKPTEEDEGLKRWCFKRLSARRR